MSSATYQKIAAEPRVDARINVGRDGTIRTAEGRPVEVSVEDVSLSGCKLRSPVAIPVDYVLNIGLPGLGRREGRVVWSGGGDHGIEFLWPLSAVELEDVRSTDNLVRADFPQRLDTLVTADDAAREKPRRLLPRRALALIAGASTILWVGIGYGLVSLAG